MTVAELVDLGWGKPGLSLPWVSLRAPPSSDPGFSSGQWQPPDAPVHWRLSGGGSQTVRLLPGPSRKLLNSSAS